MPFIASGSYGCVFKPHLKCKTKKHYQDGVGKIFYDPDEYKSEKEISDQVQKIDPHHKYTMPMYDTCETDANYRPSDEIKKCNTIDMTDRSFQQLIYKYGGKSLMDILLKRKGTYGTFKKIFIALYNVLEGIQHVGDMGYVHQDIKPDNILMAKSLSTKTDDKNAYIIDFGIIDRKDNVFTKDSIPMLKYSYPYFPPEYKMYAYSNSFPIFYREFTGNFDFQFKFNQKNMYILDAFKNVGLNMRDLCKEAFSNPTYDSSKIDVYSFGITLLMVYVWSQPSPKHKLDNTIKSYIAGLVHPNPALRSSTKEALKQHKTIMEQLGSSPR